MSRKDTVTKDYMKDTKVFADAFNYLIYGGRQVIDPKKLHELDTTAIALPYGIDGASVPIQKYRDELKYLTAMEDERAAYLILGIENQSEIHYAMPVKDMLYDALQYAEQVSKAAKSYRNPRKIRKRKNSKTEIPENKEPPVSSGEFLSGFRKGDKLLPVITLVIFFGAEEWDGPESLHEMLSVKEKEILAFIPDYRINLISPASMTEKEIDRFRTSLREVMLYIKYSKDKKKLGSLVLTDEKFKNVERKAVEVMNAITGIDMEIEEDEENVDMCEGMKGLLDDAKEDGILEGTLAAIKKMMKALGLSEEQAMKILEIPEEDYPAYLSRISEMKK